MESARSQLITLIDHGVIESGNIEPALRVTGVQPSGQSWRQFIERTLTWFGVLALAIALVFFIAYNWNELGRTAKFALVQLVMIAAIITYVIWPNKPVLSPALLVGATIALGALMAFYGQTYQTGADPWNLFFGWAMLMLPWTLIGSTPVLWLIFLALVNLALSLYFTTFGVVPFLNSSSQDLFAWSVIALNGLALAVWESLVYRRADATRYATRYGPRLVALAVLAALAVKGAVDVLQPNYAGLAIYLVLMGAAFVIYRYWIKDLFVLAAACLNAIVDATILVGRIFLQQAENIGSLLLLAGFVMAAGAGTAVWLRTVHQEFSRE